MGFVSAGFYEILTDFCRQFSKSRPAQLASIKLHQSTQLGSDVRVPDARVRYGFWSFMLQTTIFTKKSSN